MSKTEMRVMADTNVLLNQVEVLDEYDNIYLCVAIIDELDKIKERSQSGDLKLKGRIASRYINSNLDRITIVEDNLEYLKESLIYDCVDQIIVSSAKHYECVLLTNDLNVQHRCEALGVQWKSCVKIKEKYTGHHEIYISPDLFKDVYSHKSIKSPQKFLENACVTLTDETDLKKQALTVYKKGNLHLINNKQKYFGVAPLNREQQYAMHLLADDSIPIICIDSSLGSGKSFMTMSVALQKVIEDGKYDSILYVKPLEPMGGNDIGYLKHDKNDKLLNGYSGTVINTIENIYKAKGMSKNMVFGNSIAEDLIGAGKLEVEAITFMRGMSYSNKFVILDESSNLNIRDLANILGRIGSGSKICCIGCSLQVDNIKLNSENNGLAQVIDRLKDSEFFGTIRLNKIVRSDVASLVVDRFEDILV